ncbi:MAG: Trk system potassium transporter TrkA, partial [Muribaculaceae bacterium]|nr:Trk system potassium transporter TrkA [Muribaculaceae bacterium]
HLAQLLSRESQDIILIDADTAKLAPLDANYNLMTIAGAPTSFQTLREANVSGCDLFIAVTPFETDNVTACAIAKSMGAKKTVARIDNYEYMRSENRPFLSKFGVNDTIYPEYLAALEIQTALQHTWARQWFELHDGELILLAVKIRGNAKIVGMKLRDVTFSNHHFHVSAIKRRHETLIPRGDDVIRENDILYFTTTRDHLTEIRDLCGKTQAKVKKVMVMGGSKIAARLSQLLGKDYKIKIIENDIERCRKLPERCPNADIVCADARDNEVLVEEGISEMDAFVALSDSSETNILACLTAKEYGVAKTVAEVENLQFISEAEGLNIGTIINKKLLASSKIFQLLIDADTESSKCMALADAEVAEFEVKEGARVCKAPIKDLSLPHGMTMAGLIRNGKGG